MVEAVAMDTGPLNTSTIKSSQPDSTVGCYVRSWHLADVLTALSDVCCLGESGRTGKAPLLPLVTLSRHHAPPPRDILVLAPTRWLNGAVNAVNQMLGATSASGSLDERLRVEYCLAKRRQGFKV